MCVCVHVCAFLVTGYHCIVEDCHDLTMECFIFVVILQLQPLKCCNYR